MWICDCCKNVNADTAANCVNCGDFGPLGEEMRKKAVRRPGEQLIWLLFVSSVFLWPFAALLPMALRRHAPLPAGIAGTPAGDHAQAAYDAFNLVPVRALAVGLGVMAAVYLVWATLWIVRRRRAHKALVDTDDQ